MNRLGICIKELAEIRATGAAQLCQEAGITGMHISLTDEDPTPWPW